MSTDRPPAGPDPATASKLQILATEHWSLLATRSLTYTEGLGRVTIFLAILSGAMIALALVAQGNQFGTTFDAIGIFVLSVVVYTGITTISRLNALNRDDYRWVVGMNRLRNAYFQIHPELEAHFITSGHDDLPGALRTLGFDMETTVARRGLGSAFHLLQTLPGMLTVIVAAVGGAIGALVARLATSEPLITLASAIGAFLVVLGLLQIWDRRAVMHAPPSLEARFPTPSAPESS